MSGQPTPAVRELSRSGTTYLLHTYVADAADGGYGIAAAHALGVEQARLFKTLVAQVDGALHVAVVPVSSNLDLKALAAAVGGKRASMAEPSLAERATGYVRGGISPLGLRRRLPTVIDGSARHWGSILLSAGRRGLQVELAPGDLVTLTGAVLADIATRT